MLNQMLGRFLKVVQIKHLKQQRARKFSLKRDDLAHFRVFKLRHSRMILAVAEAVQVDLPDPPAENFYKPFIILIEKKQVTRVHAYREGTVHYDILKIREVI